jgi:hypothetical protein
MVEFALAFSVILGAIGRWEIRHATAFKIKKNARRKTER